MEWCIERRRNIEYSAVLNATFPCARITHTSRVIFNAAMGGWLIKHIANFAKIQNYKTNERTCTAIYNIILFHYEWITNIWENVFIYIKYKQNKQGMYWYK